jgi:hypothetical protein
MKQDRLLLHNRNPAAQRVLRTMSQKRDAIAGARQAAMIFAVHASWRHLAKSRRRPPAA